MPKIHIIFIFFDPSMNLYQSKMHKYITSYVDVCVYAFMYVYVYCI